MEGFSNQSASNSFSSDRFGAVHDGGDSVPVSLAGWVAIGGRFRVWRDHFTAGRGGRAVRDATFAGPAKDHRDSGGRKFGERCDIVHFFSLRGRSRHDGGVFAW